MAKLEFFLESSYTRPRRPARISDAVDVEESNMQLDTIQLAFLRISHALRSPLSVLKGVTDDLQAGQNLEQEDFIFASQSVTRMCDLVDSLRDWTLPVDIDSLGPGTALAEEINRELQGIPSSVEVDERLEQIPTQACLRLIKVMFRYIKIQIRNEEEIKISISPSSSGKIQVSTRAPTDWFSALTTSGNFEDAARQDHSPEALGLIFINEVCNSATQIEREDRYTQFRFSI